MEGDAPDDVVLSAEDEHDVRQMDVRFCGNQDELAVFDDIVIAEETVGTRFMDNVVKEWFTNNLSTSLSAGNSPKPNRRSDLGQATINKVLGSPLSKWAMTHRTTHPRRKRRHLLKHRRCTFPSSPKR